MSNTNDNLLGEANSFIEVLEQASQVAPLNKPVLVIGERGAGKGDSPSSTTYLNAGKALLFP